MQPLKNELVRGRVLDCCKDLIRSPMFDVWRGPRLAVIVQFLRTLENVLPRSGVEGSNSYHDLKMYLMGRV